MGIVRYLDESNATCWGFRKSSGLILKADGDPFQGLKSSEEEASVKRLLAPVRPTAVLAIGLNYRHHAAESGMPIPEFPVVFMKTPSALQHPEGPIEIPRRLASDQVDYEAELAVVIGKTCKNVNRGSAFDYVLGYTCANDVSARDWQLKKGGGQWCRGKTFDTFLPLGPELVTPDEIQDPGQLKIRSRVNGQTMQDWHTGDMIFDVPALIEFLSGSTTLETGTVILTGTPHGVGAAQKPPRFLQPGDQVEIEIERIGVLRNPVQWEGEG